MAEHLRRLRASRGMSLRQLARASRVNASTLSRWESGTTTPRVYELEAVLNALQAEAHERLQAWQLLQAPRAAPLAAGAEKGASPLEGTAPMGGELLRALRIRRGWTLERVALHLGVTVSTISRWERSESWPSAEHLARLCEALGATPEEHQALQSGQGVLMWLPFEVVSPSEIAELLDALDREMAPVNPEITDLLYRCLQGRLWQMVSVNRAPMSLLIDALAYHCRYLVAHARVHEAQMSIYRALRLITPADPMRPHWFYIIHAQAKNASECGARLAPMEGVDILRRWLPHAERYAPEHAAWFWRNIAEYLSFSRRRKEAHAVHTLAQQKSNAWREEDPNILLSEALVLANLGHGERALRLLQDNPILADPEEQRIQQSINKSLVWVRVLCQCGMESEAQVWRLRLQQFSNARAPHTTLWWKRVLGRFSAPAAEVE
ncbi:MAG: helix-turn-helix domain-containing protein [Armatimonadetes bacterium]|nr:helix-turn-helix domain-containing protein [Armatimonadota bacterium]